MNRLARLGALAGLLGVLTLSGCTGDEAPPEPAPGSESASEGASSPTESPTESDSAALDGPTVEGELASFQVPEGYRVEELGLGIWNADQGSTRISLIEVPDVGDQFTLRQLLDSNRNAFRGQPQVSYDAELGGQPAFVAEGVGKSGEPVLRYGALISGNAATLAFSFEKGMSPADQDALVESVVATWTWR